MRWPLMLLILGYMGCALAADTAASYQQLLEQYIEKSSTEVSPFSAEDMAIMQKAGKALAASMPRPGLQVGDKAPNFELQNALGKTVSLQAELEKGPVVLVFYRGAWCPFCNMHLHSLRQQLPRMQALGAQLIAVTPQKPDRSATQIREKQYDFEILSDLDSSVMKNYRLYFELPADLLEVYKKHGLDIEAFNGEGRAVLPVPGSFVIDASGVVRAMHAETDYKQRMEPARIIAVLQDIAAE